MISYPPCFKFSGFEFSLRDMAYKFICDYSDDFDGLNETGGPKFWKYTEIRIEPQFYEKMEKEECADYMYELWCKSKQCIDEALKNRNKNG